MKISLVLLLSTLSLGNSEIIKRLVEKQNKACVGTVDKFFKLGKKNQTLESCKKKCKNDDKCVAMQYVAPKFCSLYYSPLEKMKNVEDANSYCGRVKTEEETTSPLITPKQCELRAILKYPWGTNPDDAPYYGYVTEYLEVREVGDDWWVCSGYYRTDLPAWCKYSNTSPDPTADGANLENYEDYYDPNAPDIQTSETVIISGAAARVFNFDVLHWFWDNDYYTDYETWNDHMIASVLKIKNLSNPNQKFLSDGGWSHPVDINTKTHIQDANGDFSINPAYKGDIRVVVWCDDNCFCNYSYEVL